ncbi:DUF397 domain-containing protein [Phytohabitans sp. ZYX-F-186]|uniref:DUF397 domain-containing protein n=1 Tax=Phytohabitans maris TaxID=3071409 RepID=A0ABU0ZA81_9ACTN|nr:DUF397 domain-containing protein [Phytohabitans sp. ZYX-F-186]MDQ7903943.1 DUF397 domain-containing protein [Phytohabitans sp. ZYX-F-186]
MPRTIRTPWYKSTRSAMGNECVEVRASGQVVQLRDSKHPDAATLSFVRGSWHGFIAGVKLGEFDRTG